jgi:putative flippase GtrA
VTSPRRVGGEFLRFCIVGAVGFVVDAGVLYLLIGAGVNPYGGRVVSYLVAATTTWSLHRVFTFAGASRAAPGRQWVAFVITNAIGGGVNWSVYALVVRAAGSEGWMPLVGVAVGSGAGLAFNYLVSRRWVFAPGAGPPAEREAE